MVKINLLLKTTINSVKMITRYVRKHRQLFILLYFITLVIAIYSWISTDTSTKDTNSKSLWMSRNNTEVQKLRRYSKSVSTDAKLEQVPEFQSLDPITMTMKHTKSLFIKPENDSKSHMKKSEVTAGHSQTSRLESVFLSVLSCPGNLSLKFMGMDSLSINLTRDPSCPWIQTAKPSKERNFVMLGNELAVLKDVTVDPSKFRGCKGGEKIDAVLHQSEHSEYFHFHRGFFQLPCSSPPRDMRFHVGRQNYRRYNHLNKWLDSLTCSKEEKAVLTNGQTNSKNSASSKKDFPHDYVPGVTLALQRFEYANLYHTMLDWYNTFLSVLMMGIDPRLATVLIVDGHPLGKLDSTWATLFGGRGALRAGHLPNRTTFQYMVWIPSSYHCPLYETQRRFVPFLPQLREYFFQAYGVEPSLGHDCGKLRILLVRRRDYLAHPRNPKGELVRKIANEDEIHDALSQTFPKYQVRAEQLDLLSMRQQLEIVGQTDILLGMHGAALTYTALLPPGAGLVELYPKYAGRTSLLFKQIAHWRGVHYTHWMNSDDSNERDNKFTYVPPPVVVNMVKEIASRMCADFI